MSDPMQRVLKGVVRDHRLPSDYGYKFTQPMYSRTFLHTLKRFFVVRQLTKQHAFLPIFMIFVSTSNCLLGFRLSAPFMLRASSSTRRW